MSFQSADSRTSSKNNEYSQCEGRFCDHSQENGCSFVVTIRSLLVLQQHGGMWVPINLTTALAMVYTWYIQLKVTGKSQSVELLLRCFRQMIYTVCVL